MNAPAAIRATYSDLRLVKGRKVAVIYLEIPIEQAEQFVGAFGMPNPAEEKWVGIARLVDGATESAERKRKFSELRPSAQAALLCKEPTFWAFLREEHRVGSDVITCEEDVVRTLRDDCGVNSRSEFDQPGAGATRWRALHKRYEAWMAAA